MCICEGVVLRHKQRYHLVLSEVKGRRVHVVVLVQVRESGRERKKQPGYKTHAHT